MPPAAPAAPAAAAAPLLRAPPAGASLWVWGKIDDGRLGVPVSSLKFSARALALGPALGPTPLPPAAAGAGAGAGAGGWTAVACAASKTLALAADGSLWSWGTCAAGSLGHGAALTRVPRPRRVEALAGVRVVGVACGETASAAVSDEGDVYTWGWGGSFWKGACAALGGLPGRPRRARARALAALASPRSRLSHLLVPLLSRFLSLVSLRVPSLSPAGNGGLGHGDSASQPRPALVEALSDARVRCTSVSVGARHMLARTDDGRVFSWGDGEYGRCGNGRKRQLAPEPVELLAGKPVAQAVAGRSHSLALTDGGEVWVWGKNDAGQLGLGGSVLMDLNTMEEYPLLLDADGDAAPGFARNVAALAAGANHSLALTKDGRVFQWGQRTFLQPQLVDTGYLQPSDGDAETAAAEGEARPAAPGGAGTVQLRGVKVREGSRSAPCRGTSAAAASPLSLRHPPALAQPRPRRLPPATACRASSTRTATSTPGATTWARACSATPSTAWARGARRA